MNTYYPCSGIETMLHIIELNSKKTLCGITPARHWQMVFEGEVFPEVGKFVEYHPITKGEGFYVGRWFAPKYLFCKTCYKILITNQAEPVTAIKNREP